MATKPKTKIKKASAKEESTTLPKSKATPQKQTKSQIFKLLSEETSLSVKDIKNIFLATSQLAKSHLIKKGSGEFSIPEMGIKIIRKTKPAAKKRQGRNLQTGESIIIPAKPKREVIRTRILKSLKELLD